MITIYLSLTTAAVAGVATGYQAWTTRRFASPFRRAWILLYGTISLLSWFYVGAFTWLLAGNPDRAEWSRTLMPVSVVSFVVVWTLPSIVHRIEDRTRHES